MHSFLGGFRCRNSTAVVALPRCLPDLGVCKSSHCFWKGLDLRTVCGLQLFTGKLAEVCVAACVILNTYITGEPNKNISISALLLPMQ